MTWLRTPRAVWAAFGLIVVLGLAWVGWSVWQVQRDLSDAVDSAERIQDAVEARDTKALDRELRALRAASASAADRTSGPTWALLTKVPAFGDDADGIKVTSRVLSDLAHDGIEPLVTASDRFDDLLPQEGRVDVDAVRQIAEPVDDAAKAFAIADEALADVDASGFVGRLHTQFVDFREEIGRASRSLHSAKLASGLMPALLGGDDQRTYLLAFQNNAELRATGGLPGAVAFIKTDDGKVAMAQQMSGGSYPTTAEPILPLTEPESDLYGDALGTYFVDAGMTPDVPRAADLMRAHAAQRFPDVHVDGVIMVDTVALAYLLEATGPITVDGVLLDGETAVDELLHNTYLRLDSVQQDVFFAEVAKQVFAKVTAGTSDPATLMRVLARAVDERRILLNLTEDSEQEQIAGTLVAGELTPTGRPEEARIDLSINDTTGSKMSYYLATDSDVRATSCVKNVQNYAAKMRLRSTAPADAATLPADVTGGGAYGIPAGTQLVTVRIFGPVGGSLGDLAWNGTKLDMVRVEQDGRPVGMTYVQLEPGQVVDLAWTMKSGPGQTGETKIAVTPTVEKKDRALTLKSACG